VLNAPVLPFVVQATPTTVNGVAVPAGVYANDLFVKNGTITNAKIANLAVDDAKIANLSVSKLDAGSLKVGSYISSANYVAGSQGFGIWATGAAEFNNVTVRGTVYASSGSFTGAVYASSGSFTGAVYASSGSFSGSLYSNDGTIGGVRINGNGLNTGSYYGYAWPTDGGGGFHLGPNGLLTGNANLGKYLQLTSDGNIYAPQLTVVNGNASFSGNLQAANGTFSGTLTAAAINAVNTINIAGNAVTTMLWSIGGSYAAVGFTVPPGQYWECFNVASFDGTGNLGNIGGNFWIYLSGVSGVQPSYITDGTSDGYTQRGLMASRVSITGHGEGYHVVSASSSYTTTVTLACNIRKR
jgi:hypothetical protein